MSKTIVLINGKKRAGKDFLAEAVQKGLEQQGINTELLSFATPIKEILATTLGISLEMLDILKNDESEIVAKYNGDEVPLGTGRTLPQRFGTDAMTEHFGKNVWVNYLQGKVNETDAQVILVPDFRFPSEAISPFTVKVYNFDLVSTDTHVSENALDNFEFLWEVDNTGHLDLTQEVDELVKRIKQEL